MHQDALDVQCEAAENAALHVVDEVIALTCFILNRDTLSKLLCSITLYLHAQNALDVGGEDAAEDAARIGTAALFIPSQEEARILFRLLKVHNAWLQHCVKSQIEGTQVPLATPLGSRD